MAKKSMNNMSGKMLNPTEHKAISKLMKFHQPMLKEMEKWKEQREKLEMTLLNQIDAIGEVLKPYYSQSKWEETLANLSGQRVSASKYPNKKRSTSPAKKKATTSKSRTKSR